MQLSTDDNTSSQSNGKWQFDPEVLPHDFAVKITSDFDAKRRPQNRSNLLQIRRISDQVIKRKQ